MLIWWGRARWGAVGFGSVRQGKVIIFAVWFGWVRHGSVWQGKVITVILFDDAL